MVVFVCELRSLHQGPAVYVHNNGFEGQFSASDRRNAMGISGNRRQVIRSWTNWLVNISCCVVIEELNVNIPYRNANTAQCKGIDTLAGEYEHQTPQSNELCDSATVAPFRVVRVEVVVVVWLCSVERVPICLPEKFPASVVAALTHLIFLRLHHDTDDSLAGATSRLLLGQFQILRDNLQHPIWERIDWELEGDILQRRRSEDPDLYSLYSLLLRYDYNSLISLHAHRLRIKTKQSSEYDSRMLYCHVDSSRGSNVTAVSTDVQRIATTTVTRWAQMLHQRLHRVQMCVHKRSSLFIPAPQGFSLGHTAARTTRFTTN